MKRDQQNKLNHMEYLEGMEQTESDILEKVMNA